MVDLKKGDGFAFLGFQFRRILSFHRKWRPHYAPKLKMRTALFATLREIPTVCQLAGRICDCEYQSGSARLGELLSDRTFEFLFHDGQGMGRTEGQASSDACPGTARFWPETVE